MNSEFSGQLRELREWGHQDAHETFLEEQLEYWMFQVSLIWPVPKSAKPVPYPQRWWLEARLGSDYRAGWWVIYSKAYRTALTRAVRVAQSLAAEKLTDDMLLAEYDDIYSEIIEAACMVI